MSKTKRIKVLEEFIRLEKLEKNSRQDYIEVCEEAANKLKNELKAEEKRVSRYLILISQNTNKRKESYSNRKLIKAGERKLSPTQNQAEQRTQRIFAQWVGQLIPQLK